MLKFLWLHNHRTIYVYMSKIYLCVEWATANWNDNTFACMLCTIHVCCSPGIGAHGAVDELVTKTCEDADVFVCVFNGTGTLERLVNNSCL